MAPEMQDWRYSRILQRDRAFLLLVVGTWAAWTVLAVTRQGTWVDETNYIVKAWWYITGAVPPYSEADLTAYLPLHFYALGSWQQIFGHDVIPSRLWSVFLTIVNGGLAAHLLYRLGARTYSICIALIVFALNEESVFYFSSATPYALAVCLQLLTLHVLVRMIAEPRVRHAIAMAVLLTLIYLVRIDLSPFIALMLGTVLFRVRRVAWLTIGLSAGVFALTLSVLGLLWGREFVYVALFLPGMPDLFPAIRLTHSMYYDEPFSVADMFRSAFRWEIVRDWIFLHHAPAILAALFAACVASIRGVAKRAWIAYFTIAYFGYLLFYLVAGQFPGRGPQAPAQCSICVQAYLNYVDYLAALAGGLAVQEVVNRISTRGKIFMVKSGIAITALAAVVLQLLSLSGKLALPSAMHQTVPLPAQVNAVAKSLHGALPTEQEVAIIGYDRRIFLALARNGIKFPPWTLVSPHNYRRLNDGISSDQASRAINELESLSGWTDSTAERWLRHTYQWLLVQDLPIYPRAEWLPWHPSSALVVQTIRRCFVKERMWSIAGSGPPLALSLYRRRVPDSPC